MPTDKQTAQLKNKEWILQQVYNVAALHRHYGFDRHEILMLILRKFGIEVVVSPKRKMVRLWGW